MNCRKIFDGRGGEIAHSWMTGNVHFDLDEDFRAHSDSGGVYLLRVALHEIGHVSEFVGNITLFFWGGVAQTIYMHFLFFYLYHRPWK